MRNGFYSALGMLFLWLINSSSVLADSNISVTLALPAPPAAAVQVEETQPVTFTPAVKQYVVRKGNTLEKVFGKKWKAVCEHNALKNCDQIRPGQILTLPAGVVAKAMTPQEKPKSTRRPVVASKPAGGAECIHLGADPYNPQSKLARTLDGIDALTELTAEQKYRARLWVIEAHYGRGDINTVRKNVPIGKQIFKEMLSGISGIPKHTYNKPVCSSEPNGVPELMDTYDLGDGIFLGIPQRCGNPGLFIVPLTNVAPEAPLPPTAASSVWPHDVHLPLSAFPKKDLAEWEMIVGAGVWDNKLAHGRWHFGEGIVSAILPNGFRAGIGAFGMGGRGESDVSAYNWRERGFGLQGGIKQNFLKEQRDEFGQTALLPAMWGLKLRYLPNDRVKGHNPDSGYAQIQKGKKLGAYVEYIERKNEDWLWGATGEIWHSFDRSITSTWSGDTPQDRGSLAFNLFAQYRIDDDWQARGILGASYQNWDKLFFGNTALEARYKETVMFGPRLSAALNKPKAYRGIPRGDLTTLGGFVRLELGDTFRTWDSGYRESMVQYVGPVDPTTQ